MIRMMKTDRGSWALLDDLASMQDDFSRLFDEGTWEPRFGRNRFPPVNVWQSADSLVVEAALPGVDPKAIDIAVVDGALTLSGQRAPEVDAGETVLQRERPTGEFSRTVQLPFRVDAEQVQAAYKLGVLRITLPRAETDKPKRIFVKAA